MKRYSLPLLIALILISSVPSGVRAQLNPFGSMYFLDQYQANPAMAGMTEGLYVSLGARSQWAAIPGAPTTQVMTAQFGKKNVGVGLNFNNDAAGLLKRTRALASYAYHLPLNDNDLKFSFGLSLGFMNQRVLNSELRGDQNDVSVSKYNSQEIYVDGDFGIAVTDSRLNLQLALPNLKSLLGRDTRDLGADHATFLAEASYRLSPKDELAGIDIEPKFCFRGVHGFKNIFDAGSALWFNEHKLMFQTIYHSTQAVTFGLGLNPWSRLSILGIYTTETADLRTYASGNFEIGIKVKAF